MSSNPKNDKRKNANTPLRDLTNHENVKTDDDVIKTNLKVKRSSGDNKNLGTVTYAVRFRLMPGSSEDGHFEESGLMTVKQQRQAW